MGQILKSAQKNRILRFQQGLIGGDFQCLSHALAEGALPQGNKGFGLKGQAILQEIGIGVGQGYL